MADFIGLLKKNKKDIIIPSVVLLVICIVIPLALSLTNSVTKDRIASLEEKSSSQTMKGLIDADEFESAVYDGDEKIEYYIAKKSNETVGYVFKNSAKGYGGDVSVMIAMDVYGEIKSVAILDVSGETPGLGQNAAKKNFYTQYNGKSGKITLVKNGADSQKNEINAVTGATITSTAVNKAVNAASLNFKLVTSVEYTGNLSEEVSDSEK